MGIFRRIGSLFNRSALDREIEAELAAHICMRIEDNIAAGMSRREATRDARLRFGNATVTKERVAAMDTNLLLSSLWADARYALRQFAKNPGFAITAILMIALGTGASVAIFAFVDAALLKPLPYRDPTRIASVTETVKLMGRANLSYPDYLDWKRMNTVFQSFDVYAGGGDLLNTPTGAMPVPGLRVTDGFFRTLGVHPMLGRDFYEGEDLPGTGNTVILSYAGWQKWFAGRQDILGQKATLSGIPYTIVGVLPKDFDFAPRGGMQFWLPFHAKGSCDLRRSCHGLEGIARLKDGVTMQAALAEMQSIAAQLERQYPGDNRGQGAAVDPLSEIIVGDIRPILLTLLAGAGLLMVIASVNVASLLLVRSESRKREFALRGALGASRIRLIRQFLVESFVMVAVGSSIGVGLSFAAMRILMGLIPEFMMSQMPFLVGLGLNNHVLAFAIGISGLSLLLFALTPMLRLPLLSIRDGLAEGGRASAGRLWRRLGANLVIVELAIAVVLLVGAGLLAKSFYRLLHVDVHFHPEHLALVGVMVPETLYPKDQDVMTLQRKLTDRISALPGVESVGLTSTPPVSFNGNTDWIRFVGRPYDGQHIEVNMRDVSADYIHTLQAKLMRGRLFTDAEDDTKPKVVIINQTLAKMYFPNQDPIGQRFGNTDLDPKSLKEIIGVVDDIKEGSLDSEIWPAVYYPINQDQDRYFTMIVRTSEAEGSMLPTLVNTIHEVDRGLGTDNPIGFMDRIQQGPSTYLHRSSAWLVGGFAAIALILSVVGLYGVIAYSVSQRTREIGVRMALGAQRGSISQMVLKEASWLTAAGIGGGLICAIGAAILMRKLLFGTAVWDAPTLCGVALVLGASALLASYIPARRAASVDPMIALRCE